MKDETNQEPIGSFKAEPKEPVVNVEEASEAEGSKESNADLQGLINNRDALIREKRSAQDKATGLENQLSEQTKANSDLQQQIDDLLVAALVNDISSKVKPVEGAKAFINDLIRKQVLILTDDDGRRAQINNDLSLDDLVNTLQEDNKSIVYGVDSSGGLNANVSALQTKPTQSKFGLR